jgi:hypothetical protein
MIFISWGSPANEKGRQWLWMKSAIATSIQAGAFGSIALPQSFIWVTTPLFDFFELKNELGVLLLGVLLLTLELLLTDQGCLKGGRPGKISVLPPNLSFATVGPAYDLEEDNAVMNTVVSKHIIIMGNIKNLECLSG